MVGPKDIAEIAKLARLALSADEQRALQGELAAILAHMAVLANVDTRDVEPMIYGMAPERAASGAVPVAVPVAEEAAGVMPVKDALHGAAVARAGQFVVPNVLTGQDG